MCVGYSNEGGGKSNNSGARSPLSQSQMCDVPLESIHSQASNVSCYASLGGFMLCCFLMGLLSLSWAALYRNPDCDKRIGQVNINHCKDENDLFNRIQSIVAIAGGGLTLIPVVWLVGLKCCCYSFNKPESYTLLEGAQLTL